MSQSAAKTQPAAPQQPSQQAPPPATPAPQQASAPQEQPPYKILGNHNRKITILVNAPGSPFLPDNQLSFLTKILEACRMNVGVSA